MTDKELIIQLRKFSREFDCIKSALFDETLDAYHNQLLFKGRLIHVEQDGELLGYVESWRINYEKFGRKICGEAIDIHTEDIQTGKICYINNVTINPDARRGYTIKLLRNKLFLKDQDAEYVVGERNGKKHRPVKVFKMRDMMVDKAVNMEELYGFK